MITNKKYLIKNITPWMIDELLAISEITKYDLILLREPKEFFNEGLEQLSANDIDIFIKPFKYNYLFKKLIIVIKFIFNNVSKFGFNYNGVIGIKSILWFLKFDLNHISKNSNIHSQFATQASLLSLLLKKTFSEEPNISFTFHAYDIYFENKWFDLLVKNCYKAVSISNFNVDYVKKKYNSSGEIVLSRLGVFRDKSPKKKINNDVFTLGLLSWFVEKKGIEYLLEALTLIKEESKFDFKLFLAGDGPLREEIQNCINKNDLNGNVILLGKIKNEKKDDFFKSLDVFVLPSIKLNNDQDGIPVVMMEAIAYSLPLISTNISGIPEICVNNYNGLLIEERDSKKIADSIKFMMLNKRVMNQFSKNSYKLSEKYDIRINSKEKLNFIDW